MVGGRFALPEMNKNLEAICVGVSQYLPLEEEGRGNPVPLIPVFIDLMKQRKAHLGIKPTTVFATDVPFEATKNGKYLLHMINLSRDN